MLEDILKIVVLVCCGISGGFVAVLCKDHNFSSAWFFLMMSFVFSFLYTRAP